MIIIIIMFTISISFSTSIRFLQGRLETSVGELVVQVETQGHIIEAIKRGRTLATIQGGNPVLPIAAIQHQVVLEERMQRLEDGMKAKDVPIEEQSQVITQLMELSLLPGRKFNSCVSISDYNKDSRNINSTIRSSCGMQLFVARPSRWMSGLRTQSPT